MISAIGAPIHESLQFHEVTTAKDSHRVFKSTKPKDRWQNFSISPAALAQKFWRVAPIKDANKDIYFITSRESKMEEFQKLLQGVTLVQAPIKLPALDQEEDLIKQAVYRVLQGHKQLQAPCFIEEAALNVVVPGYLRPIPGHNYRVAVEQQMGKKAFAKEHAGKEATTLSVLAYTPDGETIHVFTGDIKGTIINPEGSRWVEVDGWDPFFQPSGYQLSLAELRQFKHLVNMRLLPCAEMRSTLREKDYSGVYEVHITVSNAALDVLQATGNPLEPSEAWKQKFKDACNKLGVKALIIGMDDSQKPVQLQTAAYHAFKNFREAVRGTNKVAQDLLKMDFPILRVRLEAMLFNAEVPKTDEEALEVEKSNYSEFHARLVDVPKEKLEQFKTILASHCKNEIGTTKVGHQQVYFSTVGGGTRYFVNMRAWQLGSNTALSEWRDLLDNKLKNAGFQIAKEVKPEYCVYDEVPDLDYLKSLS